MFLNNEGSEFGEMICNGWESVREGLEKFAYCSRSNVRVGGHTTVTTGTCPEIAVSRAERGARLAGMKKMGLLLLAWLPVSPLAFPQSTPATTPVSGPNAGLSPAQVITLGSSVVPLEQGWKFEPGDSPWVNGVPVWAQAGFDDSRWAEMDLSPKAGSVDVQGRVLGWTRRGYPDLSGFAWYRLRLKVNDPGQPLWLKMPLDFDDAYQIYANGRYVGQFGGFSQNHVKLYYDQPLSFQLPGPGPDGVIALAVRFYMSPSTRFLTPDVGGMHAPPALGLASTVRLLQSAEDDHTLHKFFGSLLTALIFLLVAPLVLWACLRNRRERMYLWLFLALACTILGNLEWAISGLSFAFTSGPSVLFQLILGPLILLLWVLFWWRWFGLSSRRWVLLTAWALTAAQMLTQFCASSPLMGLTFLPPSSLHWFNVASLWCTAGLGVLLLLILIRGLRRDRTEGVLATAPILLLEFGIFYGYFVTTFDLDLPEQFYPFGLGVDIGTVSNILMVLVIAVLALRRFVRTRVREEVERKAIAQDLEQAQQLQQKVLVPETVHSSYFTVEAEYRPAQTVGGDFFQTLSKPDGSLLVVIGDVSGKGVSAAMLVAVLVGAIRNRAEDSFDPASMLARLNRRMIGRSGGHFATCLAAELSPDGTMQIANAGHLPPYLNGKEMELVGSLPLGMVADSEISVQTFTLRPGDRLTFMTDGVVEATNEAKELFGFERAREISGDRAAAIAEQAQSFGQEDDITVVGVSFAGVAV
jgi:hypothetical protein